jgi:cytoskeletal protein CcmA (bactofilin family)
MRFMTGKAADEVLSFLGEGAELSGEITFTNTLRVNGVIKGKVRSEATLEIGSLGRVEAEVNIRKISINGEFRGVIQASDRVEIHKDGKVFGDIYSPCLIIEAGAVFEGHCSMKNPQKLDQKDDGVLLKPVDSDSGRGASRLASGSQKNS